MKHRVLSFGRYSRVLPPPGPAGASRGFTLFELILTLILIGLVATFALPKVDIQRFRTDGAARTVGTTLLAAQRQAVTVQHDVVVSFDQATNALRVHDDANNNGVVDAGERVRVVPIGEYMVLGRGSAPAAPVGAGPITFTRREGLLPAITFHRSGSASEAGGVYLASRRDTQNGGYAGDTRLVEVERSTGRTSWLRYRGGVWVRSY